MKLKIPSIDLLFRISAMKLSQWHKWFAWYPVRIDEDTIVWMSYVERKKMKSNCYPYNTIKTTYKLIERK